jgi:hypothetical protein
MPLGELIRPKPGDFVDDLAQDDGTAAAIEEFRAGHRDYRPLEDISDRVLAVIHRDMIVAGVAVGIRPFVPGQARRHGQQMFQANRVSRPIRKDVAVFREKAGDLPVDAADEMLIDRDPDQDGIDGLRRRVDLMERIARENPMPAVLQLTGIVSLQDEPAFLTRSTA